MIIIVALKKKEKKKCVCVCVCVYSNSFIVIQLPKSMNELHLLFSRLL